MADPDTLIDSFKVLQQAFRKNRTTVLSGIGSQASAFKADTTPVTEIDMAVENSIIAIMKESFPDLPVLGEENGYDPGNLPNTCWLIDPIDGTKSFINSIPAFTGMAALIHEGISLASLIYDYSTGSMYTAYRGQGAFKDDKRIDLTRTKMPKVIFCKEHVLPLLAQILASEDIDVKSAPSGAGYGFIQVADTESAGRFHLHAGMHIHDHAPGALLIEEAGGKIIPVLDSVYSYRTRSFIACHPDLESIALKYADQIRAIENPSQIST